MSVPHDPQQDLPEADAESFARQILLQRLTDQPRSRAELAESLAKKNVPADVAVRLLDRFEEVGLIDDAAFARMWVESRQRSKGLGRSALARELRKKGIDDDVAAEALEQVDADTEVEAAHQLVQKKLRSMQGLDRTVKTRRLTGMLARKGYSPNVAFSVVREELGSEPEPLESM
ncbi:regulatory protein RecX [Aeromicrobium sp. IC_218]|uniref:regulatory protein RecX n=1 Tax=Aeromicrobium sp. IC_218 TaxID=2545468 RepID=UPI00103F45C0|nr:regulatory protein RecX [Aeromicrobium sp. IC_218]TCJ00243.1 regulatory protein RecX [Aeromicrobium sp. IC_218]